MTPWPFSYLPGWTNFLAIWIGYTIILLTAYRILMAIMSWWVEYHYRDEIDEWNRMRQEAQKVRDNIGKN